MIGLPPGQELNIAESAPYSALAAMTPEQAVRTACDQRADFKSAKARVRAAEEAVKAARGERYPNVAVSADYGDVGPEFTSSHGTFTFQAAAKFNIFDSGRISADIIQARAALKQRRDELADLGGQIELPPAARRAYRNGITS